MRETLTVRLYPVAGTKALRSAYAARHRASLLVLPAGVGKTVIIAVALASAIKRGKCCLVLAHRRELIRQASDKLRLAGVPHGIIALDHPETAIWFRSATTRLWPASSHCCLVSTQWTACRQWLRWTGR